MAKTILNYLRDRYNFEPMGNYVMTEEDKVLSGIKQLIHDAMANYDLKPLQVREAVDAAIAWWRDDVWGAQD